MAREHLHKGLMDMGPENYIWNCDANSGTHTSATAASFTLKSAVISNLQGQMSVLFIYFIFQFAGWWHTSTLSVLLHRKKKKDGACGLKAAGIVSCCKMFSHTTPVQTFRTHLHVRQDKPAMDFKTNFITTDP